MIEVIAGIVSVAISNLHTVALVEHEACWSPPSWSGHQMCLYPHNAATCEHTIRLCIAAQQQLGVV